MSEQDLRFPYKEQLDRLRSRQDSQRSVPANPHIKLPDVPQEEEDPRARINVMKDIFKESMKEGRANTGLLTEIDAATILVHAGLIGHGNQISRALTNKEKHKGTRGTEQMILTDNSKKPGSDRELDMLCQMEGKTYIVEAKNTKNADTKQLAPNFELARKLGSEWGVMYALAGHSERKERPVVEAHQRLMEQYPDGPQLKIVHTFGKGTNSIFDARPDPLERIPTNMDYFMGDVYCDAFNTLRISQGDLQSYKQDYDWACDNAPTDDRSLGWAQRALDRARELP
ncbi:hypothetical protein BJ166DRAFT_525828 [Pestalotiopsis sp. NC0098]|nr:hypothetical protein BJ166DRAFT_525828 [Pestalotiopsis sp. NC0098]